MTSPRPKTFWNCSRYAKTRGAEPVVGAGDSGGIIVEIKGSGESGGDRVGARGGLESGLGGEAEGDVCGHEATTEFGVGCSPGLRR